MSENSRAVPPVPEKCEELLMPSKADTMVTSRTPLVSAILAAAPELHWVGGHCSEEARAALLSSLDTAATDQ